MILSLLSFKWNVAWSKLLLDDISLTITLHNKKYIKIHNEINKKKHKIFSRIMNYYILFFIIIIKLKKSNQIHTYIYIYSVGDIKGNSKHVPAEWLLTPATWPLRLGLEINGRDDEGCIVGDALLSLLFFELRFGETPLIELSRVCGRGRHRGPSTPSSFLPSIITADPRLPFYFIVLIPLHLDLDLDPGIFRVFNWGWRRSGLRSRRMPPWIGVLGNGPGWPGICHPPSLLPRSSLFYFSFWFACAFSC